MIDFPTDEERRAEAQRLIDGLSGRWVAERMTSDGRKIGKETINLWRNGKRIPDLEDLIRLTYATGRPLDPQLRTRIFGGDPVPAEKEPPATATG